MEHSHTYLLTNAQWLLSCYKAEVSSCAENKLCLTPEAESIYYLDFYKKSLLTSVVKNLLRLVLDDVSRKTGFKMKLSDVL